MYWIDKVIEEIKSRCADFDVDKAMKHAKDIKNKKSSMPPQWEWMMVVEVSAEPIEEPKFWVPEEPKLPSEVDAENCPECWKNPCECEKPEEDTSDEVEAPEIESEEEDDKAATKWMKAITDTKETMEEITPAEQDKMDEILKAIKTFFPNENTEDVLVRIVSKLIDR